MDIKVGDIVKTKEKDGNKILPAAVTKVHAGKDYYGAIVISSVEVLFADGTYGQRSIKKITKTGRHIDMQSVLDSIKL